MNRVFRASLAAGILAVASQQAAAVSLQFDYSFDTNDFFADQARRDALEAAGTFFSAAIQDDLTAITSSGGNSFNVNFSDPATDGMRTIDNFSVAADTLTVYAGGRVISGSTIGVGGPGGFVASGTSDFVNNAVTRGETSLKSGVQEPTATDFAPWGGSIAFNSKASWYFDTDTSTTEQFAGNDFFSVALHELGHLLGFGIADSWANLVSESNFTGAASSAVFSGNVPLNTDSAHWENGTTGLVNGVSQEAAMDPSITQGTRKVFTHLDLAALTDTGWEVTAVPVPAAIWLFASGMMGLVITAKRRFPFSLNYPPGMVKQELTYRLTVTVAEDPEGRVELTSMSAPVLTQGHPSVINLAIQPPPEPIE